MGRNLGYIWILEWSISPLNGPIKIDMSPTSKIIKILFYNKTKKIVYTFLFNQQNILNINKNWFGIIQKDRIYTDKSDYWLASQKREADVLLPARSHEIKAKIWLKFFVWRQLSHTLGTAAAQCNRGILLDPVCQRCRQDMKTTNHILFTCPKRTILFSTRYFRIILRRMFKLFFIVWIHLPSWWCNFQLGSGYYGVYWKKKRFDF